jgi:predicted Zn-dependent peptidase
LFQKTVLDNGLRVVTENMPQTRSASICIFIRAGSRYESDATAGISHFVEHVLFRGTNRRPTSCDISAEIEGVGGVLNGATDRETTVYWCKVPQPHFELGLDVLSDMLLCSRFEPDDIEKERTVIIEEINMSYDTPSSRVGLLIDGLIWHGHPLGRDIAGTKKSVDGITQSNLMSYVKQQYVPENTVISIAGNVPHEKAVEAVRKQFGKWCDNKPGRSFKTYAGKQGPRFKAEYRDIEQTHLCLALPGLSIFDTRHYVLDIMNVILGEGMSCRLFSQVRDKLGLAYNVHSFVEHLSDTGALTVYAGVDTNKLELAVQAIENEVFRLRDQLVTGSELTKAKELAKGHLLLRLEDSRSVAGWQGSQETIKTEIMTVDQVIAKIDAVNPEALASLAAELISIDKFKLALVGPVASPSRFKKFIGL